MTTTAAQVSKLCKQELKKLNINCRVKSENFSMGNSVNVYLEDFFDKESFEKIKSLLYKYNENHRNDGFDNYEATNYRTDVPQVKYLFIDNGTWTEEDEKICLKYIDENPSFENDGYYLIHNLPEYFLNWLEKNNLKISSRKI